MLQNLTMPTFVKVAAASLLAAHLFMGSIGDGVNTNPHPSYKLLDHSTAIQDTNPVVAPGSALVRISDQFKFTEGPAADRKGNVYFTDQPNNNIWRYAINGKLSLFMSDAGRSNGLYIDNKGNIISCADADNELWQITTAKKVTVLAKGFQGKRLNGPNDLWIHPDGSIYFTDPFYKRDYWKHNQQEQPGQYVFYFNKKTKAVIPVDTTLERPNGIVGTKDGKTLYVADIAGNKTYRYRISSDGTLSDKQLFVAQGSDGMTLDTKGNVYLSGKGVTVYNPEGQKIAYIPVPANWTANLCFSGKNMDVLFITASESVFTLQMKVKG
jgi:gluconolactonase